MKHLLRGVPWVAVAVLMAGCQGESVDPSPIEASGFDRAALEAVVAGDHRTPAYAERDQYRHPVETLEFFGLSPDMIVVREQPFEDCRSSESPWG